MALRSPIASNWLRQVSAINRGYSLALVPEPLVLGFLRYYQDVARSAVRVTPREYKYKELRGLLHPDTWEDMQQKLVELIKEFPHMRHTFSEKHQLVIGKDDSRPFDRDFDEADVIQRFEDIASSPPVYGVSYADAIQYNLGNGILRSLPIPAFHVSVDVELFPMGSLTQPPPRTRQRPSRRTRSKPAKTKTKPRSNPVNRYKTRSTTRPKSPRATRTKTRSQR